VKLSEHAWAESVPNLEIETNDVRCSHASTVGPIDEDQRFYLESRGVPTEVAERLVVAGFFAEVLEDLPVAGLAPLVQAAIDTRLEREVEA
jgi:Fe-S cluster assembly protein SufD